MWWEAQMFSSFSVRMTLDMERMWYLRYSPGHARQSKIYTPAKEGFMKEHE